MTNFDISPDSRIGKIVQHNTWGVSGMPSNPVSLERGGKAT
jgi:hypothetical protein